MELHPELAGLLTQIEANCADARRLTESLSDIEFNLRPPGGGWSISECLAHLNVVNGLELPGLMRMIEEGKAQGRYHPGPYRYGWFSRWLVRNMGAQVRRKFRAPKLYRPPGNQRLEKVLPEYLAQQDRVAQLVRNANGLDLARIKTTTPASRLLRFSLGIRLALIAAHDRRHLAQAWRVRRQLTQPSA